MGLLQKIKLAFRIILVAVFLILGVYFAVTNDQLVQLSLFNLEFPEINLGFLVVIALTCGVLLGFVLAGLALAGRTLEKKVRPS